MVILQELAEIISVAPGGHLGVERRVLTLHIAEAVFYFAVHVLERGHLFVQQFIQPAGKLAGVHLAGKGHPRPIRRSVIVQGCQRPGRGGFFRCNHALAFRQRVDG